MRLASADDTVEVGTRRAGPVGRGTRFRSLFCFATSNWARSSLVIRSQPVGLSAQGSGFAVPGICAAFCCLFFCFFCFVLFCFVFVVFFCCFFGMPPSLDYVRSD
jgi:hypothetical protein